MLAPDLAGFGYTDIPDDFEFRFMATWIEQLEALLDSLGIKECTLGGNSFGGALTLWMAAQRPTINDRLV